MLEKEKIECLKCRKYKFPEYFGQTLLSSQNGKDKLYNKVCIECVLKGDK